MKSAVTTVILCCMCFFGCQSSCRSGPDSCSFRGNSMCHWTATPGWKVYNLYINYYLGLKDQHSTMERLESRKSCSTNSDIYCLKFEYNFEEDNALSLSVIIKTAEFGEKEVWKMSSSGYPWDDAQVPVNTSTEFTVIFEARSSDNHRVYIDDIEYEEEDCNLYPQSATPPPTTPPTITTPQASTTPTADTTPVPSVTTATTTTRSPTRVTPVTTMLTTPITPDLPEHTSSGSAPTTPPMAGRTTPAQSSSNVGLIAGVVVAVVFLMVVGVVLFVLFKRKQTHDWKTCFTQQKGRPEDFHDHSTHNAVYTRDEHDPDQFINLDINPVNSDGIIQRSYDTTLMPPPAENHYSVIENSREGPNSKPSMAEYVNVNSPKQPDHYEVPPDPHSADDNPYENGDSGEVLPLHSAPAGEAYNTLDFHTPDSERCEGFLSSCDHSSDYNHVSGQQPQTASPTDTGEGPGLYQAIATCHTVRHHQPPAAQHHTVSSTDTHGSGPSHTMEQQPELSREDQSVGVYQLPMGTSSSEHDSFPNVRRTHAPSSKDPTKDINYALQKPVELSPESSHNYGTDKTAQYQHLDFDGKTPGEERSDDVSAQVYSHLNAGSEGAYDVIDRKPDKEQRDGEYSHI